MCDEHHRQPPLLRHPQLELRADKRGRATYRARFYSGGRQVKRRLGLERQAGLSTGLTKTMAEGAVAKLVEQQTRMVPVAQRVDLRTAGERYLEHLRSRASSVSATSSLGTHAPRRRPAEGARYVQRGRGEHIQVLLHSRCQDPGARGHGRA